MPTQDAFAELVVSSWSDQDIADDRADFLQTHHRLACVSFGAARPSLGMSARQHVHAEPLHPLGDSSQEHWLVKAPARELMGPGFSGRHNQDLLFGVIEVPEPAETLDGSPPLEQAARHAYTQLFEILDKNNFPYVWRSWNYMPAINQVTHGLERYRQFNAGRGQGFAKGARVMTNNVPAACALGVQGGPLSVAFLAGRTPTLAIENPRQTSAYHYPRQYGAQSPTFSRASLARLHDQELLFLSGTASIVGHQTLHTGDVRRQTAETLANIEAVVAQTNLLARGARKFHLHDLQLRVYVRHAGDVDAIRSVLAAHLAPDQQIRFLHADICRSDLDVEIEGIAWREASSPSTD